MTFDRRVGRKLPEFVRHEDVPGTRIAPGPYVGKIKNNLDPTHSGRLQVWIPEFGGDEDNTENWRTVAYASPFLGSTTNDDKNTANEYEVVPHTYGMWFTVPDLENFVLCTFVAGDPKRGFWFACVPKNLSQYMIPAVGSSENYDPSAIKDSTLKSIKKHSKLPVVELNENSNQDLSKFKTLKKPIHEDQLKILVEQGIDRDELRGIISSSSQRESPSSVFGFSTPGRPITDPAEKLASTNRDEISPGELAIKSRRGGHSLVLDDGDAKNKNQLIRLRSATGHQIILNDTDGIVYIINNKGTAWIELADDGKISVFSNESINMRAKGDFNLHSDKDINLNAEGNVNFRAKQKIALESDEYTLLANKKAKLYAGEMLEVGSKGSLNLHATGEGSFSAGGTLTYEGSTIRLNSGPGAKVTAPDPLVKYKHPDAEKDSSGQWQSKDDKIESVAKIVTAHEPYKRQTGAPNPCSSGAASSASAKSSESDQIKYREKSATPAEDATNSLSVASNGKETNRAGEPVLQGNAATADAGIKQALISSVKNPADKSFMTRSDNPNPPGVVGSLATTEVKALMTQIAVNESSFNYNTREAARGNFLGKYQLGAAALVDQGYIKPDAYEKYGFAAVRYPTSWTGKDNIKSDNDFLNNSQVQESAMYNNLQRNYKTLESLGGIKPGDDKATVSGMLATAHLLGAGGANNWRKSGVGADANNTTGAQYFNAGRYAQTVLSKVE
jgi:hypothetical protein